ncbi:uncharacterized protein LOC129323190 [Prosopis cineraria]|uniref:uncharacterized protein LOC129323190 n=1 Tax=Prosopis cineraria TaxID=364024 RepID=UPI00240FD15A|nr:uncharacterized protein LOC129323190 [Prosopis cineraria]XP_054825765.1 uncharacterized protein LOC129323190 [Prosopis cineraria]XP_054825766.1 uncharacterized protein LOC129323190 [Prosopis cineraria]
MNWFESAKNANWSECANDLLERTKNVNWSEITKDLLERVKNVNWSESVNNLMESAKNSNWSETARNLGLSAKNWLGDEIGAAKESVEIRHLVVGGVLVLLVVVVIRGRGSGGASNGRKIMKAPGGKGKTMYRDVFEGNPRSYFRGSRNKKT